MTKALEEVLNLPSLKEALEQASKSRESEEQSELEDSEKEFEEFSQEDPESAESFSSALQKSQEFENKLADKAGLLKHDGEMDKIAVEAMDSYRELMDLGMNVSPAHAGKIFETATHMLKIALESKNSKSDKKLRMWRLQLEEARLMRDLERDRGNGPFDGSIEDEDTIADRNVLLQKLKDQREKPDL